MLRLYFYTVSKRKSTVHLANIIILKKNSKQNVIIFIENSIAAFFFQSPMYIHTGRLAFIQAGAIVE